MLDEGRLEAARARLRHAALLAAETGQSRTREVLSSYLALGLFEAGELAEAEQWLDYALGRAQRTQNALHSGNHGALLGAVLASRGQLEPAERCFAEAEAGLVGLSPWAEVARVHRGHLHLARARRARGAGNVVLDAQERTLAEGCLRVADTPARASSDDLRIAARILERALLADGSSEVAPGVEAPPSSALILGEGLRWFSVAGGERVDLARRPLLRSLLGALAEQHEVAPGEVLERATLIAHAWPGERYNPEVHVNRLHVALSTLRSLGLRELLERSERGYRLDRRVELHRMVPLARP
jgi:tetratricopeptide (TPR) repeat protein